MKYIYFLILVFTASACGGSLSEEQRKAFKNEMKDRKIKRVSDDDIYEKALEWGRLYVQNLNVSNMDSVAQANEVSIQYANQETADLSEVERKIFEAYSYATSAEISDNVQKQGTDILYANPVMDSTAFQGVWFISIPKKKIVLDL